MPNFCVLNFQSINIAVNSYLLCKDIVDASWAENEVTRSSLEILWPLGGNIVSCKRKNNIDMFSFL